MMMMVIIIIAPFLRLICEGKGPIFNMLIYLYKQMYKYVNFFPFLETFNNQMQRDYSTKNKHKRKIKF